MVLIHSSWLILSIQVHRGKVMSHKMTLNLKWRRGQDNNLLIKLGKSHIHGCITNVSYKAQHLISLITVDTLSTSLKHLSSILFPFPFSMLFRQIWLREMPFLFQAEWRTLCSFFLLLHNYPGVASGRMPAGRDHRIREASREEAVNSQHKPRLPETLARTSLMKAKPRVTYKLGQATWRWNLQTCWLSTSRHCGVQIELHYSFARQRQGSLFTWAGLGRWTKEPLYELCALHGDQMLCWGSFSHANDSLSPLSVSTLLRFPPFCCSLHSTLP